jgi:hypothetical protein
MKCEFAVIDDMHPVTFTWAYADVAPIAPEAPGPFRYADRSLPRPIRAGCRPCSAELGAAFRCREIVILVQRDTKASWVETASYVEIGRMLVDRRMFEEGAYRKGPGRRGKRPACGRNDTASRIRGNANQRPRGTADERWDLIGRV